MKAETASGSGWHKHKTVANAITNGVATYVLASGHVDLILAALESQSRLAQVESRLAQVEAALVQAENAYGIYEAKWVESERYNAALSRRIEDWGKALLLADQMLDNGAGGYEYSGDLDWQDTLKAVVAEARAALLLAPAPTAEGEAGSA